MPLLFHLHQMLHHILKLDNVYLKYFIFFILLLNNSHTKYCLNCQQIHPKENPDHSYQCNKETAQPNLECGHMSCHCLVSGYASDCLLLDHWVKIVV